MKIHSILENFRNAVQTAERNTAKNQNLPILSSVFINCEGNKAVLRATNLENAVEITVPAKVEENGSVAVSAKVLSSFLSNLKDDKVTLESKKDNLYVKTESTRTVIRGYQKDEFPIFPKIEKTASFSVHAGEFNSLVESVAVAASLSDIKPELASLYFKLFKNTIKAAATDSFRLAEKVIVSKNASFGDISSLLIPTKAASEIARIFKEGENLEVSFNKNQLCVSGSAARFITRLVEGVFPDYEQIIPKSFTTEAVVKKSDILDQLKISSVFSGRLNDVSALFSPAENKITLSVSNPDIGEHSSGVASKIHGEEVELKFNWRYLMDGISKMNSEYVVLSLNSGQSPMLIKEKEGNGFFYLAMPMRSA